MQSSIAHKLEVQTTIKALQDGEFIGYISFKEPYQNIYCEISHSRDLLERNLTKRTDELVQRLQEVADTVHSEVA